MARMDKLGTKATTVARDHTGDYILTLYSTQILRWNDNVVTFFTGGHRTKMTKDRMNQASSQFGLGFTVYQRKGEWYVLDCFDKDHEFEEGLSVRTQPSWERVGV